MKRLYQILFILFLIGFTLLVLYAIPPTRPWMETTICPLSAWIFGETCNIIVNSSPYQFLIGNPALLLVVGIIVGIIPVSFPIIHNVFNKTRGHFVRSAAKETGMYPAETKPVSTPVVQPQPQSTTEKPKTAPTTTEVPKEET